MKTLLVTMMVVAASACWAMAESNPYLIPDSFIRASSQGTVVLNDYVLGVPLWPNGVPDTAIQWSQAEWIEHRSSDLDALGLNRAVHYVDTPSLMVLKSDVGSKAKPALVIFPGGSFERIVVDKEGFDIARWFLRYGITCVVVKYRTSPQASQSPQQWSDDSLYPAIVADGERAVSIVRSHAKEWSIDPNKIGIMGFSAGGYLTDSLLFDHGAGQHPSYDAIGQVPFYPDFCAFVYAAWVPTPADIPADTAPTFLTGCRDDSYVNVTSYNAIASGLVSQSISTELLLFKTGGHGFGLGVNGGAVAVWPDRFLSWLSRTGVMLDPNGPIANTTTGDRYYSFQCVLDAAQPGDTLVVQPGLYQGSFTLDKDLTLQSVDPNDPFYVGGTLIQGDADEPVVTLNDNTAACTLAGLTIRAGSIGIFGTATHATLRNCRVMDNENHGLELSEQSDPHLTHCLITANGGSGIVMHPTQGRSIVHCQPTIDHCVVVQNRQGSLVDGEPVLIDSIIE